MKRPELLWVLLMSCQTIMYVCMYVIYGLVELLHEMYVWVTAELNLRMHRNGI